MNVYEKIISRRTIRKFKQVGISVEALKKFVNAGRLAPSAGNLQPLEYMIVTDSSIKAKIFETLSWAIYLKPEYNPKKGEEPAAYIIVIVNKDLANEALYKYDVGASVENITLAALEEDIGCCWIGSFKKEKLTQILNLPQNYFIDCVLALGYPLENPAYFDIGKGDSIKYHRDQNGRLNIPKRKLEDIIHLERFDL
jgi:nitroreductase